MLLHHRYASRVGLAAAAALAFVGIVVQEASAQSEITEVEEVIVTARRTGEKLQDVPLAVTAISADALTNNSIKGLTDLNALAPSLNFQRAIQRTGTGTIFFRGLTNGAGAQGSKASVFLDGDYMATNAQNVPFNFMQRVEVLPGPQSAQFGRATFGGALNYVTKEPTRELSAVVHADYATLGDVNVDGLISGPLAGDRALRGLLFVSSQKFDAPDSWRTDPDILHPNGVRQWSQKSQYVAAKLAYDVTDDLSIKLMGTYANINDGPSAYFLVPPTTEYLNAVLPRYTNFDRTRPIPGAGKYNAVGAAHFESQIGPGIETSNNYFNIQDPNLHSKNGRVAGQLEWSVLDGHTLKLGVSWEKETVRQYGMDFDFAAYPGLTRQNWFDFKDATALEARFSSPNTRRLRYSVGLYSLRFNVDDSFNLNTQYRCISNTTTNFAPCIPTSYAAVFNPTFANGNLVGFTGVSQPFVTNTPTDTGTLIDDKSAFGMVSYDFTDKLTANLEARYQSENQVLQNRVSGFVGDETFKSFVPRVNLQYKFTPDVMVFALYSLGNNPGGFNPSASQFLAFGATPADLTYKEEKLQNYEVGIKSELFDRRLTANLVVYHMLWKDQTSSDMRNATNGINYTVIGNKGVSRVNGMELDVHIVPVKGLNIQGNMSYNNAKYVDYCSASGVNLLGYYSPGRFGCIISDGNYLENVPAWTASLQADYAWSLRQDWLASVGASFRHRDGQWDSDQNLLFSQGQNKFDLRAGVQHGRLGIELFCANCGDDKGSDRITNLADQRLGQSATLNRSISTAAPRPRQVGVKTTFSY